MSATKRSTSWFREIVMAIGAASTLNTNQKAVTPQVTNPKDNAGGLSKLTEDFTTFIKLLTVQLKNQNPLDPTDTNEFTDQIVQFANVEQNIAGNQKLD